MKIVNFSLNNFRGISGGLEKNKINFQGINTLFIFGQNNAGKSTFLKGYEFFYYDEKPCENDFHRKDQTNSIQIEIEVELDERDHARIQTAAPKAKESYKEYLIEGNKLRLRNTWALDGKSIKKSSYTWKPSDSDFSEIGYASVGLHSVFQHCLPRPIHIKAMPNEDEAKAILNEILKSIAESKLKEKELQELKDAQDKIKELQDRMYNKSVIEKYQDSVNTYIATLFPSLKVSIDDRKDRVVWSENKLGKEYDISFKHIDQKGASDPNLPEEVNMIGHGTIRTAIFTLLLMRDIAEEFERVDGRKDYLVLFEEPELFLYPKIIRDLRDLIYRVSEGETPYQLLCASHSPSMIDITKLKSSIVRLVKDESGTHLHQISDAFLKSASDTQTDEEFKQEMYEILRFNPHICEAFYSDEVILVEGPTEEIIIRAFLQEYPADRFFFVLNCGTVNNIPFYQKVLSKFRIRYSVICDTDKAKIVSSDSESNPSFDSGIQKSISEQFLRDKSESKVGILRCHQETFEPAHRDESIPERLRMPDSTSYGKPFDANKYWKEVLQPNLSDSSIGTVPIISFMNEITCEREDNKTMDSTI